MSSFYLRIFSLKDFLLLFLPYVLMPIFLSGSSNLVQTIVFSNYICIVINISYLIFNYVKINELNRLIYLIVPRIGNSLFYKKVSLSSYSMTILFLLFQYGIMTVCYGGIPPAYEFYILRYTVFYFLLFLIMQSILCMQIAKKMNIVYFMLPVMLDLIFHYYFVQIYFAL